jgi:hypothetical protein
MISLAGAIAVALVALHLLTRRFRRVPVATSMFWRAALAEDRARSLWQRFRHPVTLLLLLLIAMLILVAIGRPEPTGSTRRTADRVVIVDVGATMRDRPALGASRIELAKRLALQEAFAAPRRGSVAVIAAGAFPSVVHPFDESLDGLDARIDRVAQTDRPSDLHAAIAVAQSLVVGRSDSPADLVVITDAAGAATMPTDLRNTRIRTVGQALENSGIGYVHVVRGRSSAEGAQVEIGLCRWARDEGSVRFVVSQSGRVLREMSVKMEGRGVRPVRLEGVPVAGEPLTVSLTDGDGLGWDDTIAVDLGDLVARDVTVAPHCPPELRSLLALQPWVGDVRETQMGPLAEWTRDGRPVGQIRTSAAARGLAGGTLTTPDGTPIPGRIIAGGPLASLPDGASPRLVCGQDVHLAVTGSPEGRTLWISEAMIEPQNRFWLRREFVACVARFLAETAPDASAGAYATSTQGQTDRGDLLRAGEVTSPEVLVSPSAGTPWFAFLLAAAMLLSAVEVWLFATGRIP